MLKKLSDMTLVGRIPQPRLAEEETRFRLNEPQVSGFSAYFAFLGTRPTRLSAILLCAALLIVMPAVIAGADDRQRLSSTFLSHVSAESIRVIEFDSPQNLSGLFRLRTDVDEREIVIEVSENVYNIPPGPQADRILKSITVSTEVSDKKLRIIIETPYNAEWMGSQIGVRAELNVSAPPDLIFQSTSESFDFELTGPLKTARISSKYGKLFAEKITESADLRSEYGEVTVRDAAGEIEVRSHYGTIKIEDVTVAGEPLWVSSERGEVELTRIGGPVKIDLENSPLAMTEWQVTGGTSRISSDNSSIDIGIAVWKNPTVSIEALTGDVFVSTPKEFSGQLRLNLGREQVGKIHVRDMLVKATHLDLRTLEGIVGDAKGLLEVSIEEYGDIILQGSHPRPTAAGDK